MSTAAFPTPAPVVARTEPYAPPPLTRWGITWRYLVASAFAFYGAMDVFFIIFTWWRLPVSHWLLIVWGCDELVGIAASAVLVRYRRRWPLRIAYVLAAMTAVSSSSQGFATLAFVSLCTRLRWREIVGPALVWVASNLMFYAVLLSLVGLPPSRPWWLFPLLMAFALAATLVSIAIYTAVGMGVGAQRREVAIAHERVEQAQREQQLLVSQGKTAERARIAREMHDVVAHRMSLVAMHAGALSYRTDLEPEQMRSIARGIQENSNAALTELRAVLADLREEEQPSGPQPSLPELPRLLEEFRAGGMRLEVRAQLDDVTTMTPTQSRHAYRIVQETLTNARKHAVNSPVALEISGGQARGLTICVRNPRSYGASVPGAGMGLVGLRERAQLAGGTLSAGPEHGDFVVKAWLPWNK